MDDAVYAQTIKQILSDCTRKLCEVKWMFLRDPLKDFTRDRKITFEDFVYFCLQASGGTLQNELMKVFEFSEELPTKSAFCQQRAKVSPEAMEYLYSLFTEEILHADTPNLYKGYRVLAVDGSDVNIPYNPDDAESFQQNGSNKGFNQLHLNAAYDMLNGIYVDCVLNTDKKIHERAAFLTMVDRVPLTVKEPVLYLADMGYEGYNVLAHLIESGQKFLIRLKDDNSNGVLSTWDFSEDRFPNGEFDCILKVTLTWKQTNEVKANRDEYRYVSRERFDFYTDDNPFYRLELRVLCIEVAPGCFTYIATNMSHEELSLEDAKYVYHLRWSEERAFRDLKYTIDLVHFHCKKRHFVEQEIWAKLLVYNFCEAITRHIAIHEQGNIGKRRKHDQKINFSTAACICKEFLKRNSLIDNPCRMIKRFLTPVRPGRSSPRNVRGQSAKFFIYRAA